MSCSRTFLVLVALMFCLSAHAAENDSPVVGPIEHIYATHDGVELKAFLFAPAPEEGAHRSAIAVFHGGGWSIGAAEWGFGRARHFAELGMVAVSVQYRLSDEKEVTPIEAMADARAAIRWMRSNADSLGLDPDRIAAYGWSAGAHLAACAAIFTAPPCDSTFSCAPNALLLFSPAVSLGTDRWVQKLLGTRADAVAISPDEHVHEGLPPTIVLQGRTDTVTPLEGTQRFVDRMIEAGNRCDLHVYDGVGHLFTPSSEPDNGYPNPDPKVQADAYERADAFLRSLGFIE